MPINRNKKEASDDSVPCNGNPGKVVITDTVIPGPISEVDTEEMEVVEDTTNRPTKRTWDAQGFSSEEENIPKKLMPDALGSAITATEAVSKVINELAVVFNEKDGTYANGSGRSTASD